MSNEMEMNMVNEVNSMGNEGEDGEDVMSEEMRQELQLHHQQLQHHQHQLQMQQQHLHHHQQQQHHQMQHNSNGLMVDDRDPELLLPVASTSATDMTEVIGDNDTIIKAANKAGYNVKRHLDALTFAKDIVERYKERGNVLPKEWSTTNAGTDPAREQEYKDAGKLRKWKQALRGSYRGNICAKEIREYLDEHMPTWRIDRKVRFRPAMQFAMEIVERCQQRGGVLPRFVKDKTDPTKIQEFKDAQKLKGLKQGLVGVRKEKCSDEVRDYLDKHIPQWRDKTIQPVILPPGAEKPPSKVVDPLDKARAIVERYMSRGGLLPKEWSDRRGDPAREQEYKDAGKLRKWRQAIKGIRSVSSVCPDNVREFLDKEMPTWRSDVSRHRKKSKTSADGDSDVSGSGAPSGAGAVDLATDSLAATISNEIVIGVQVDRAMRGPVGSHMQHEHTHHQLLQHGHGHGHSHGHGHGHGHHGSHAEEKGGDGGLSGGKRDRNDFEKDMTGEGSDDERQ